jgi:hypothetical protein
MVAWIPRSSWGMTWVEEITLMDEGQGMANAH